MKKRLKLLLFMTMVMLLCALPLSASAASKKTKALKAYASYLSKSSITLTTHTMGRTRTAPWKTKDLKFAIAYLDNDNIPELILTPKALPSIGIMTFTYKNGKVKMTGDLLSGKSDGHEKFYYYKKKSGVAKDNGEGWFEYYLYKSGSSGFRYFAEEDAEHNLYRKLMPNGEVSECRKSSFNSIIKRKLGTTKKTAFVFYNNTKQNRAKYLK